MIVKATYSFYCTMKIFFTLLIVICLNRVYAQPKQIQSAVSRVTHDQANLAHLEPFLWVNNSKPDHVIIACIVLTHAGAECHVFTTLDGGKTWKRNVLQDSWVDPWIASDRDGNIYLSTLKKAEHVNPVIFFRSFDQGISWEKFSETPIVLSDSSELTKKLGALDRPSFLLDGNRQFKLLAMQGFLTQANQLVMTPVLYSASKQGVFDRPVRFIPNNLMSNVSNLLLHQWGIGAAFMDFGIDKGGETESIGSCRVWWVNYTEEDQFSIPYYVTRIQDPPTLPQSAIDKTSGRIYITFSGKLDDQFGIYVIFSDDQGQTWSDVKVVVQDNKKKFVNPIIAINKDGVVGVAWYDNVLTASEDCWDVRFSSTGNIQDDSFKSPVRISSETFCTTHQGQLLDGARRWKYGGDYFGLSVDSRGQFHIAWSDTRSGVYQVYYLKFTVP